MFAKFTPNLTIWLSGYGFRFRMNFCQVSIMTACIAVVSNGKKDGGVTENYDYNGDELASLERMIKSIPNDSSDYDVTTAGSAEKRPITIVLPDSNDQQGNGSMFDSYWDMSSESQLSEDCKKSSGSTSNSSADSGMYFSSPITEEEDGSKMEALDQYDIESYEMVTDSHGDIHLQNRLLKKDERKADVNANVRTKDDEKEPVEPPGREIGVTKLKPVTRAVGQLSRRNELYAKDAGIPSQGTHGTRKLRTIRVRVRV